MRSTPKWGTYKYLFLKCISNIFFVNNDFSMFQEHEHSRLLCPGTHPPDLLNETIVTATHLSQGEARFPCLPHSSSKDTFPSRAQGPLASKGTGTLSPPEPSIKGHPGNSHPPGFLLLTIVRNPQRRHCQLTLKSRSGRIEMGRLLESK